MSERLIVTKDGDHLVLQSRDIEIKETIWSWGSDSNMEYYGRDVDPRSSPEGTVLRGKDAEKWLLDSPNDLCWEWRLTKESAENLVQQMKNSVVPESPYRLSAEEVKASEYLIERLTKALEEAWPRT